MNTNIGKVVGVNANLLTVEFEKPVMQNEVAYAVIDDIRLKTEIIRVRGRYAEMQVFEDTAGLKVGDQVEFTGEMLSVELGPGLLSQVFDGLQNPLPRLAEESGFFLQRGKYLRPLDGDRKWHFWPLLESGVIVRAGDTVGAVREGIFDHNIMVPFRLTGKYTVLQVAEEGDYTIDDVMARLRDEDGREVEMTMTQKWPIKIPIKAYAERLRPTETLITKVRLIDTFSPVAKGGVYCVPGPFGAGKTVLQQITSRHAEVDVVIIAACGERAGEVVETIREFPKLIDPRTERSLFERTLIICNTSSMPVAAREASVYTAITIAEYYRQIGLDVLMLADSTSRWAQALREMSGRLEEIPGDEAFPAYLESVIAAFYERGGLVRLNDGRKASVTIGGTVSPAGGNFEEPVTQATLKVVGAFHGLSRARSDARRYPAVDILESWSKYSSVVDDKEMAKARAVLRQGADVGQMMKVLGEDGVTLDDFILHLKAEFLDDAYLQQDAYHEVDGATSAERQGHVFDVFMQLVETKMEFSDKNEARRFFQELTQMARDWNRETMDSRAFADAEQRIKDKIAEVTDYA
ncbi:V-type ATP synthase subunit A [Desulfovibrio inopinatus]|uniref:V-type ATP synthase subunit A n=1 Tax=Desulfovibrio inopinatus TaxID=102109 RepID=UPI00040BA139|nr:V-type ATP synthase subunit A [Desulfovibrio inopinatus]